MRLWIAPACATLLLAVAACGGGSQDDIDTTIQPETAETSEPLQSPPPAQTQEPTPAPTSGLEAIYSPVVLAYRGINQLVEPTMESEGFEFVLGAPRERLEEIDHVTVHFPDGREQELNPSTDLGVSLDFFGYYGTTEGLPPTGEYVFEIVKKDGETLEVVNDFTANDAPLPSWVNVDIDRDAGTIDVTWEPVPNVKNYTVDLQLLDETRAYTFAGAGCPDPDDVDPNALNESYLTEEHCLITGLNDVLNPGVEYGVQVAVWSYEYYGGIDGASLFVW